MSDVPIYEAVAQAFVKEGTDTVFTLMGDGNMHWVAKIAEDPAIKVIHVRHEHCAAAAAMGYALATDKVGVASTTCGPGFTQTMTALASASYGRVPLVLLAGETPMNSKWHNQRIDQPPFAAAAGAHYIQGHSAARILDNVFEAFFVAKTQRRPVVLGIPYDLQRQMVRDATTYRPSSTALPPASDFLPNPARIEEVAERLAAAKRPIFLAGRGVMRSDAKADVERLAERCGALLSTTLLAKGLFDASPFTLGIAGGYGSELCHEVYKQADLVIIVGASLSSYTSDGGKMFGDAYVIHIDADPPGLRDGLAVSDLYVKSDAKAALTAIEALLAARNHTSKGFRSDALAKRIATEPADSQSYEVKPGTFHPGEVIAALDGVIPKDWRIVTAGGHSSYFTTQVKGRSPSLSHTVREFGAIGNGLSYAMGVAAANPEGRVVLIEGDGGLMMHLQELETIQRHGLKILIVALNDGAFGAEVHKLRLDGIDPSPSIFGIVDFARLAGGFGLHGANVNDLGTLPALLDEYERGSATRIWNFPISDTVMSLTTRRGHAKH